MKRFDAHNHLQLDDHPVDELISHGIVSAVCSTVESDWNSVLALRTQHPNHIVAGLGIHPWWADHTENGWATRLEKKLIEHPYCFVGEAGFDGYRASRARGVVLETQRQVLLPQLHLAKKYSRPIMLHCVKAWEHLAPYLREERPAHFAIHRFKGTSAMVQEIMDMDGYLSIHLDSLFHAPTVEAIRNAPLHRLLLETDYDGPRVGSQPIANDLAQVADELAKLMGKNSEWIVQQCNENACKFYGLDSIN